MVTVSKDYSVHLVGLGGAGANVLESFLRAPKVMQYLQKRGMKFTCLALDVADHDIMSLQHAYERFMEQLKDRGLSADRVSLNARSIKFTTPQSMFDFVQKYPDFIRMEGGKAPVNYAPWLSSSVEIPPLAGGVGRRRALSKAIYGLNYYSLRLLDTYLENFKESVSSSVVQPIIFVIFGVGGGSGSGMAVDFVRHLRRKIGTGFPIIGIGILPCPGDDPRAKGASCYAAINELQLLIDGGENKGIRDTFGSAYENPFTSFIMMPLAPAYKKIGNLTEAQRFFDDAIVDIVLNTLKFDLAEVIDGIGCNLAYSGKNLHIMTTLRVTYPVTEYIALAKLYFERLNKVRVWRKERNEMLTGSAEKGFGGLEKLLSLINVEFTADYGQLQTGKQTFDSAEMEANVRDLTYSDKSVEFNLRSLVKSLEGIIRESVDEVMRPMRAIGLEAREGSPEARLRSNVLRIMDLTRYVSKSYQSYHEDVSKLLEEMNSNVIANQRLTFREKNLLNDFIDVLTFVDRYLLSLRKYTETRILADKLIAKLSSGEVAEWKNKLLSDIQNIIDIELKFVIRTLSNLFRPAKAELSAIQSEYEEVGSMGRTVGERLFDEVEAKDQLAGEVKKLEGEMNACLREAGRSVVRLFSRSRKRQLEARAAELKQNILEKKLILANLEKLIDILQERRHEYSVFERRTEFDSEYRKLVEDIHGITSLHYDKLSDITRDRGYYDRIADMTEDERLRITEKILMEEEDTLTRENILNEIVDIKRFRDYLTGAVRVLQIPGTLGVENTYRTNFIWISVLSPKGIWTQDLDAELKATLSSYLTGSASRGIHIAHIESEDPWTIRILVVASRAELRDLDVYAEMKSIYDHGSESDRLLSHSLLLEQGILVSEFKAQRQVYPGLFDLVKCPACGAEANLRPVREWIVTPKKTPGPRLRVKLYDHCGKRFRITSKG
ncbi:MAG: tubulin-like doman-containing protein [Candidatus Bathyarchaeia archaeon]